MGAKWLRNCGSIQARNFGEKGENGADKKSPGNVAKKQQTIIKSWIIVQTSRIDNEEIPEILIGNGRGEIN